MHTTALLSHSTLVAAFHQNFTPILTITQLVTVRSNHSESENHDRLLLIKLLESVADCERAESKVWVIRPNQLFRNLSNDFHRSKFPMAIVWDAAGSKNWWEFSGKAQRPTLRSSCLQSQLWQFVRIMRRFLRLNITSSPGNLWQIVIYCSVMTETETNAKYSKYSLSVPVLKFETVLVFFARITVMEIRGKNSHLAMAITWETSRIWWEIWLAAKTWQRASRGSFLFSEDLLWRWKQTKNTTNRDHFLNPDPKISVVVEPEPWSGRFLPSAKPTNPFLIWQWSSRP